MKTPYERLLERREIPGLRKEAFERHSTLREDEDVKYLLGAMEPMDKAYTEITLKEAERVYKYLADFSDIRIQGSVTTDTHIRYHSDIDILTISRAFTTWEGPIPPGHPIFQGNTIDTLLYHRGMCTGIISVKFPQVTILEKSRSISLSGGSLLRKIDVVTANWHQTKSYVSTTEDIFRGIMVLDTSIPSTILNLPFLHRHLLVQKNADTSGGQNRAIRLLKTLKADSGNDINISSYDISSLVWNMDNNTLPGEYENSFILAQNLSNNLLSWIFYESVLTSLRVPNQTRFIIDPNEGTTVGAVRALWSLLYDLLQRVTSSGKKVNAPFTTYGDRIFQY